MATGQHRRRHTFLDAARQAIARYGSISRSTERLLNNRPDRVGYDRNRHNMVSMLGTITMVKITGYTDETVSPAVDLAGGYYYGQLINAADFDVPGTATLSLTDAATMATRSVLVLNMAEDGLTDSHLIQAGTHHLGYIVGIDTSVFPGRPIIAIGNSNGGILISAEFAAPVKDQWYAAATGFMLGAGRISRVMVRSDGVSGDTNTLFRVRIAEADDVVAFQDSQNPPTVYTTGVPLDVVGTRFAYDIAPIDNGEAGHGYLALDDFLQVSWTWDAGQDAPFNSSFSLLIL